MRHDSKQYKCFMIFLLSFTLFASIIIASVRVYANPRLRRQSQEYGGGLEILWGDKSKSLDRAEEDEFRVEETLDYLLYYKMSDKTTLDKTHNAGLEMEGQNYTPQYRAAMWIAKYDAGRIPIPSIANGPSADDYPFKQRYALAVFYYATGGEEYWLWKLDFLKGMHECGWKDRFSVMGEGNMVYFGVLCDGKPDYDDDGSEDDVWGGRRTVTAINLPPRSRLYGTLPPEIRHLKYLKGLIIQQESGLFGPIPYQYGKLKHMTIFALMENSLTGKIPVEFAGLKKLELLNVEKNQLSANTIEGDLDFLGKMTSLEFIALDYNSGITGTLPSVISKLELLETLSVSNCGLYGTLPSTLSSMEALQALYLDDNAFEGSVDMLQGLTNLVAVYLEDNKFNDTIDNTFFANSTELKHLDISNCSFSGSVPGHFFNEMPELLVLDLSSNNLDGELPEVAMAKVETTKLQFFTAHTNNITGPIPASIGNLKKLRTLDLSMNQFSSEIPSNISELMDLQILFLGMNDFVSAPVPTWIRNMTGLRELSLKSASLKDTIPEWMGELKWLKFLDLGGNNLTNTIPQSLGNLVGLMVLILNKNYLTGELGLGQLAKLETLIIDDNYLTGNTDDMCAHELIHFISDCANSTGESNAELNCSCCTLCCHEDNSSCNDNEWLGNHAGIWEYGYNRAFWDFEDGLVSPHINYNAIQGKVSVALGDE